jgi:hypothetical protein
LLYHTKQNIIIKKIEQQQQQQQQVKWRNIEYGPQKAAQRRIQLV